jgi:hypothetical protein
MSVIHRRCLLFNYSVLLDIDLYLLCPFHQVSTQYQSTRYPSCAAVWHDYGPLLTYGDDDETEARAALRIIEVKPRLSSKFLTRRCVCTLHDFKLLVSTSN